jgi:hypothetical protein
MKRLINLNDNTKIFIIVMIICIVYALFYLYKNFNRIEGQLKLLIGFLILGLFFGIYNSLKENNSFKDLKNNYSLTNGKIEKYFVANKVSLRGGSGSNDIKYVYFVNEERLENAYDENIYIDIPNVKPNLNTDYLVIYEKGKPKNSFILLNYPIKNSSDFEKYEELFKYKIPNNVFNETN